jgi:hypothetical protein
MNSVLYNIFKSELLKGNIDLENDTIRVALLTSSYTPNIDTHKDFADLTNEVSETGTGYTAGGKALTTKAVTKDTTDDEGVFDADNVTWADSSITARYAVIYKDTGVAATSTLIGYIDFATNQISDSGDFTIQWAEEEIINLG